MLYHSIYLFYNKTCLKEWNILYTGKGVMHTYKSVNSSYDVTPQLTQGGAESGRTYVPRCCVIVVL